MPIERPAFTLKKTAVVFLIVCAMIIIFRLCNMINSDTAAAAIFAVLFISDYVTGHQVSGWIGKKLDPLKKKISGEREAKS